MDKGVHWLVGPIGYFQNSEGVHPDRLIRTCKWEFIGVTATGEIRRFHLSFSIQTRKFTSNSLPVPDWEKAHAKDLAELYRPIAVLRTMLPKGSIATAMRAMIKPADIAEVTAIAIRGGK